MRLLWEDRAWSDYLYWQTQDKKTLKRIVYYEKDDIIYIVSCKGHYDDWTNQDSKHIKHLIKKTALFSELQEIQSWKQTVFFYFYEIVILCNLHNFLKK